jgi:hypothetical protein
MEQQTQTQSTEIVPTTKETFTKTKRSPKFRKRKITVRVNVDSNGCIVDAGKLKLARVLAEIVCSGNKQNVILLIEAKPGFGKSYAALDLAIWTAIEITRIKGGDPWYYFNMSHVAIINPDEIVRVIESMHALGIYIFDDFGVGYSARDWHTDSNKAMNSMLQTIRTDNNILIMTVPDSDWIDKVGRNILHFKVVMTRKLFSMGRTMGIFSVEDKQYNSNSKRIFHKYFATPREFYNKVIFSLPPTRVWEEYDRLRDIQLKMLKEQAKEDYKNAKADSNKISQNTKADSLMSQIEEYQRCKDQEGLTDGKAAVRIKTLWGKDAYTVHHIKRYIAEHGM